MIRNNIRNVVIGFAIGSLGVALAVTIPYSFGGSMVGGRELDTNFAALKKAVDVLEAKSFGFELTVPNGTLDQFVVNHPRLNNDPNWIVTVSLRYQGEGYDDVNQGFGVYYVNGGGGAGANKWVVNYFKVGQNLSNRKFFVTAIRP
jgi:hypothetical protein